MRVLVIPSWYPRHASDFVGRYFVEQSAALAAQGATVCTLVLDFYGWRHMGQMMSLRKQPRVTREQGIQTIRVRRPALYSQFAGPMARRWRSTAVSSLDDLLRLSGRPDVILAHSMFFAGSAADALASKLDVPFVLIEHSSRFHRGLVKRAALLECRAVAARASSRFAVSADLAAGVAAALECRDVWPVLPNSVDDVFFNAPLAQGASRGFTYLAAGSLTGHKQVDVLIRSFASAFRGKHDIRLNIAGAGPELLMLQELVRSLELSGQVSFLGPLSRVALISEMVSADAFAHASRYETFGLVLAEAMAVGLPIVAFDAGGPTEVVDARSGILVPGGDSRALSEALSRMVAHRSEFSSEEIRRGAWERYSPEKVAGELFEVLQGACGSLDGQK